MMYYKLKIYFCLAVLVSSCQQTNSGNTTKENSFGFPMTNPQLLTSSIHSEVYLDSLSRIMWSDPIMGRSSYYSATGLAAFDKVNGFEVIAIETIADDWNKSFLLTLDSNKALVDGIEIADDYGWPTQDENGNETVEASTLRTEFLTNSIFARTRINQTIYNYHKANELTEKDSIVEEFGINRKGKFVKLRRDSVRIRG